MTGIDKVTGLETGQWNVGTDDAGRVEAVWKIEEAYVIRQVDGDVWSLDEADVSLGTFGSAVEAAAAMPALEYDPWEDMDGGGTDFYIKLGPADFEEWASGETETVFLRREDGSWWLSQLNQGQTSYPTRLRGMIAGLEMQQESYADSESRIVASLELDEADWRVTVEKEGFIVAVYVHDESIALQADEDSSRASRWTLYVDGEPKGEFGRVSEAAAAATSAAPTI